MNSPEQNQDYKFMQEKIKDRPLNKRKLLRRTLITASMAFVFGLVACLTFLVLEPLFSNWLYPPEEPEIITLPEETKEMLPEEMLISDSSLENASQEEEEESTEEKLELQVEDYQYLYTQLYELAKESTKSMVTVTGVTSDMDWFDNPFENEGQTSGLIIANNGKDYLILVNKKTVETVENIRVTFCDNTQADAVLKAKDSVTGLAIVAVDVKLVGDSTKEIIKEASLGSSNSSSLPGSPVIAIGGLHGGSRIISYGMITTNGNTLNLVDSAYKLMVTDIYGSQNASGIIINLRGQVVGIINQNHSSEEMKKMISAVGISELKDIMEKMSNGMERAYVGIHGTDVTREAFEELKVPMGAYVTEIELDSPAMQAGIQSGDVIVGINNEKINSYGEYISMLGKIASGVNIELQIMRQSKNEYAQIEVPIITGSLH